MFLLVLFILEKLKIPLCLKNSLYIINRWFYYIIAIIFLSSVGSFIDLAIVCRPEYTRGIAYILYLFADICKTIETYGLPYCLLMFSVFNSNLFPKKVMYGIEYITFIPVVVSNIIFVNNHMNVFIYWTLYIAYNCTAYFLLVYSFFLIEELNKQTLFYNILIVPMTLFLFIIKLIVVKCNFHPIYNACFRVFPISYFFIIIYFSKYISNTNLNSFRVLDNILLRQQILRHSIKNEISNITITVDNIKTSLGFSSSPLINQLDTITSSANNLLNISDCMNVKSGQTQLKESLVDFSRLIDGCIKNIEPLLTKSNVTIEKNLGLSVMLKCDETLVTEAINNILINAFESMKSSGRIYVSTHIHHNSLVLTIKDEGQGITPENIHKVKELYFTTKCKNTNSGLGLWYCNDVMEKHGGELEIKSLPNIGTTVLLKFPFNRFKKNRKSLVTILTFVITFSLIISIILYFQDTNSKNFYDLCNINSASFITVTDGDTGQDYNLTKTAGNECISAMQGMVFKSSTSETNSQSWIYSVIFCDELNKPYCEFEFESESICRVNGKRFRIYNNTKELSKKVKALFYKK